MRTIGFVVVFLTILNCISCSYAKSTDEPNTPAEQNRIIPDLGIECVYVKAGTFPMGSEESGPNDEKPVHDVTISRDFWMGTCEITQIQWRALMGTDPSQYKGDNLPVEMVSWYEVVEFCRKLTQRERKASRLPEGYVYRLPTEAEWEYAARGGSKSRNFIFPGSNDPEQVAWHHPGSADETHPVGTKRPNELGLYDMAGNVWEWCLDWYALDYYAKAPNADPLNIDFGDKTYRVCRGGSWGLYPTHCRSANRGGGTPAGRFYSYGFRVVLAYSVDDLELQNSNRRLAFPGAEGFGRFAKGGRGGDVYHVTNLEDDGPGSLRHGIASADGPRTIVFDISGTIQLKSKLVIDKSCLTIAGQTAPGDGITLRDHTVSVKNCHDVIIRYIRIRLGDKNKVPGGYDTLSTDDFSDMILDHVSLSWAIDGTHDFRAGSNFTIQWSILSEALNDSIHPKGRHAMCASYREPDGPISLHHNLFSTCRDRHPTLGSADPGDKITIVDFRNNIIYNWNATANFCDHFINAVNNYWRPGPETDPRRKPIAMKGSLPHTARGFMAGNIFEGQDDWTRDNYATLDFERWLGPGKSYKYAGTLADWKADAPDLGADAPATQPAKQAYELVLDHSGCSLKRDAVDKRVIDDVRKRQGKLLDSQDQVGGWPSLKTDPAPKDTDRDGMPDVWEKKNRLDPQNPEDRNSDQDDDGYTNLEEYLNGLCS